MRGDLLQRSMIERWSRKRKTATNVKITPQIKGERWERKIRHSLVWVARILVIHRLRQHAKRKQFNSKRKLRSTWVIKFNICYKTYSHSHFSIFLINLNWYIFIYKLTTIIFSSFYLNHSFMEFRIQKRPRLPNETRLPFSHSRFCCCQWWRQRHCHRYSIECRAAESKVRGTSPTQTFNRRRWRFVFFEWRRYAGFFEETLTVSWWQG